MIFSSKITPEKGFQYDMFCYAYRLFLLFFIITGISCTKKNEDGQAPKIQFLAEDGLISNDTVISPGKVIRFGIEANSVDFNITQFFIRVSAESSQIWFDTGMHTPYLKWYGSFVKSYDDQELWEFVVRDRFGHENFVMLNIGNDSIGGSGSIDYLQNIVLGAQNNTVHGGFLDLDGGQIFTIYEAAQSQELIDIVYYFGEDDQTIASPGANIEEGVFDPDFSPTTWDHRNTTRYIPMDFSIDEFEQIENDSILIVSYIEGEGKRKAKNLESGKVFSFKTVDLHYGMLIVREVIGEDEGSVSIDIKLQKGEDE